MDLILCVIDLVWNLKYRRFFTFVEKEFPTMEHGNEREEIKTKNFNAALHKRSAWSFEVHGGGALPLAATSFV
jgi:hypothetical protein